MYNRNNLPLPTEDPRMNPSPKTTWEELQQTKKQMLQCYQVMVGKILSRITPTDFEALRHILIYEFYFSSHAVVDLLNFITFNLLKHIELEEADEYVNKSVIYLKPRIKLSQPIGIHSIWIPKSY